MPEKNRIRLWINGAQVETERGVSVAAILMKENQLLTRLSVSGSARFAVCGMGICQECRVQINGHPHSLACQTICEPGMVIQTDKKAVV